MKHPLLIKLVMSWGVVLFTTQVSAHDIYIWPSYFTVNSDKVVKVPVDVTATHTTFRPDFSMPSQGVEVYGVDGKEQRRRGNYYEGARRSTFDLSVEEEGTYGLVYVRDGSYHTRYKVGKSDKFKRARLNKSEASKELPAKAKEVITAKYRTVAMSFLTNKAPTSAVLKAKNKGFELVPVTHPADYVTGESLEIAFLFEGKPVENVEVVIEQEGPQYKENPAALTLKANEDGVINFTLENGGRYMLKVNNEQVSDDPEADIEITRVFYAFEVIYE